MFDLGGVLVENVGFDRLNALLPVPLPIEFLKTRWLASAAVRSFEVGRSSPSTFADAFIAEWQLPLPADVFLDAFASWPKGLYPGAAHLLSRLRDRYDLACLSNSNVVHWQRFDGFREHFGFALSSHLIGEAKPDESCFRIALERCGVEPAAVVFFDDALVNVAAARALGMQALHVNGLEEVREACLQAGWLS